MVGKVSVCTVLMVRRIAMSPRVSIWSEPHIRVRLAHSYSVSKELILEASLAMCKTQFDVWDPYPHARIATGLVSIIRMNHGSSRLNCLIGSEPQINLYLGKHDSR